MGTNTQHAFHDIANKWQTMHYEVVNNNTFIMSKGQKVSKLLKYAFNLNSYLFV